MPFEGEKTAAELAEWVRGVPVLGWAVDNVFYAALLITAMALIVVMAAYWYRPASESGWKTRLRVGIYTFLGTFLLLFVRRQGLLSEGRKEVRGGRVAETFERALNGPYSTRGGGTGSAPTGIERFIVGGRTEPEAAEGSGSDSDSGSDSGSDSESESGSEAEDPVPPVVGGTILTRAEPRAQEPYTLGGGHQRSRREWRNLGVPGASAPTAIGGVSISAPPVMPAYYPNEGVAWGGGGYHPGAGGHVGVVPLPGVAPVVV